MKPRFGPFIAMVAIACGEQAVTRPQRAESLNATASSASESTAGSAVESTWRVQVDGGSATDLTGLPARSYAIDVRQAEGGAISIGLQSWSPKLSRTREPSASRAIIRADGQVTVQMSDGTIRVSPEGGPDPRTLRPTPAVTFKPDDPRSNMTPLIPQLASGRSPRLPSVTARRAITQSSGAEKLQSLRSASLSERSIAPGLIEFRSRRGDTMTRTVFDERMGAVVVTEHEHADRTITVNREYISTASGHALARRETVVKEASGTRTYTETFGAVQENDQ